MSRKRKSDQEPSTEATTSVPVSEPSVAEMPVAELAPAEPTPEGKTFADKVGKKQWVPDPDPFPIASDYVAGVRLFESKMDRQVAIKFGDGSPEAKPSQAVLDRVKEAHFRWNQEHRVWTHPVSPGSQRAVRIEAEKLFQEVRQMIRHEKGIGATPEVPF